jgi:hypothetical protein
MSAESDAIDALEVNVGNLLATITTLSTGVSATIAAAVAVSENATQEPLVQMASAFVTNQSTFINYIASTL